METSSHVVIEILAAICGAAVSVAAMATGSSMRRSTEGREALVRLTVGLESISNKLEQLHVDIRSDRKEIFGRISTLETRVARIEAHEPDSRRG